MSLTAQQQQVLALIASGFNFTTAAAHAGVHRNTVTNWLKTEIFREALEQARLEKQILYWDEAETLVAEVIHDLRNLSHDPAVPPSIRLKAMLALLQHASRVLPGDAPLVLPKPMHNDAQPPERSEEHSHQPLGQHSEALERVLLYFRRAKMEDKYALHRAGPTGPYKIIAFSGVRGVSPRLVDEREFGSLDEAYHAVFMRRVHDLLES